MYGALKTTTDMRAVFDEEYLGRAVRRFLPCSMQYRVRHGLALATQGSVMTKILIADDHPSFRRGVREHLLEGLPGISVEEASNAEDMLHVLKRAKCDLVTMDITMPGLSSLEATRAIREICPSMRILVFTMHSEIEYGPRMLWAGAHG